MGSFPELPAFIWEDILEFLTFSEKILIEKKSLLLKNLCLKYGYNYKEVRFVPTFLDEDRYIAGLDDISKMRAFRAFFTRCSKLTFLYIKEDIITSFIGRFFLSAEEYYSSLNSATCWNGVFKRDRRTPCTFTYILGSSP